MPTRAYEYRQIFFPVRYPEGEYGLATRSLPPGQPGMQIEDCWFHAADGTRLHGWLGRPMWPTDSGRMSLVKPLATILWCHGNGGNVSHRYWRMQNLARLPVAVFMFDYRGYGRSVGSPSESGIYSDTEAAWNYLAHLRDIPTNQIVIAGTSLGGAPATEVTLRVKPAGLCLEATFTSIPDMGRIRRPWIPRFLIRTQMNTLARIPRVTVPVSILHGDLDTTIPVTMGRRLFSAAREPKTWFEVQGAGHNDFESVAGDAYLEHYRRFISECVGR